MKFSTRTMRTLPKTCAALGAAALMMGAGASQAHAAGSTLIGNGLHISTGAIVAPDGRTWVSDHNAGFCRVARPTEAGEAGTIEHPQVPGQLNLRTCLGGLLPDPQPGPDAAGAPAFLDPSPEFAGSGDELVFIPDGASPSSEVVRAQWNRNTGLFEYKDTVTMNADRGRPVSASVGPDENVYVSFQRETTIQRITEATSEAPIPEIVGVPADGRGAAAVAAGRDADGKLAVYVAESTGIRVLHPNPATAPTTQPAFDIPGPGGLAVSALSYDSARKLLWAGTAGGVTQDDAGNDSLVQIDIASGAVDAAHTTGFSMIGGVAAKADGNVLVLDDPALLDPSEPMGTGRLFSVGLPAAHVTRGPIDDLGTEAADRLHTKDTAPTFEVSGEGRIQCRVRGGSVDTGWVDCPEDGLYTVDRDLADGRYTISVRSIQDGVTGLPEAHVFTVDNAAPAVPKVVRPAAGSEVSGSPWFELAGDADASFLCKFDDETEGKLCKSGYIRQFSDAGDHTIAIASVDAAGNVSDYSAPVPFTVNPLLPPNTPTGWSDGTPSHRGSSLYTEGLHISAGALVAPDGSTWVADHNGGFCRVTEPGEDGPGVIEHPQVPGAGGPRTCLGGLLPEAGTGPDAAGQPALVDPTSERPGSGDEIALIPDGASPSSEVVRAQWNPDSGLFEYKDTISTIGDRTRPVAVSLGPDGAAYVVFQRSGTIQRITDPAGTSPAVETVGLTANGRRATTVAAGRDAQGRLTVYVAEDAGLTRVAPDARAPRVAQPAIALPGAPSISALTYDTKRDHLWVGTANGTAPADTGKDVVHRIAIRTGEIEENYATGYSMVGGFGLRPDGVMFVLDDPAILDPAEPMGTGRMFHVGLPAAHITRGPLLADGVTEAPDRAFVNVDRPTFLIEGDESKQCRLTGEGLPGAWEDCPADGRYRPATALADGRYTLAVRSVVKGVAGSEAVLADDGTEVTPAVAEVQEVLGLVEVHRFTVDTEKPAKPSITSPTGGTVSATPWFVFDAEAGTRLECSWNDAPSSRNASRARRGRSPRMPSTRSRSAPSTARGTSRRSPTRCASTHTARPRRSRSTPARRGAPPTATRRSASPPTRRACSSAAASAGRSSPSAMAGRSPTATSPRAPTCSRSAPRTTSATSLRWSSGRSQSTAPHP
jgi:hypothetical protein